MVKRVLHFVYQEVRGLHQAAYILALFAFGSQILAIVRDRLLAHTFGAGSELDLYYAAFRVPDLLFVLFASVLSVYVLLPFVREYTERVDNDAGAKVLSQVFTVFLGLYAAIGLVLILAAPLYIPLLFPGFVGQFSTLILLTQILLLQPLLLGLSSLCGVVTQMNHRFVLYAISPLLYNVGIIFGIVAFYPFFGLVGLVMGVVFGALGHLLVQVPFVKDSQYTFHLVRSIDWPLMRRIFAVSIPRALTLSVNQFVLLILIGMATVMTAGSVSVFQFAFNLQSVPLAIIGMSYSVAAFPTLASLFARKDIAGFNRQLLTALRHILFWSVPVIALVIILRAQIVRVLLGSGAFDWSDTRLTAAVLAVFVVSLFAQAILLLLIRAFYACGKTFMPLFVALFSAVVSISSAIYFQYVYQTSAELQTSVEQLFRLSGVPGTEVLVLVLAFALGQIFQLVVLMIISARVFSIDFRPLARLLFNAVVAAAVAAFLAYATLVFVVDGVNQDTFIGISLQGVVAGVAGVLGAGLAYYVLGAKELSEVLNSFQIKIFKTDVVAPQEDTL